MYIFNAKAPNAFKVPAFIHFPVLGVCLLQNALLQTHQCGLQIPYLKVRPKVRTLNIYNGGNHKSLNFLTKQIDERQDKK